MRENLPSFLNIISTHKNSFISSQSSNTHHRYSNCKDSILKSRVTDEFPSVVSALLEEKNKQKTDPHFHHYEIEIRK